MGGLLQLHTKENSQLSCVRLNSMLSCTQGIAKKARLYFQAVLVLGYNNKSTTVLYLENLTIKSVRTADVLDCEFVQGPVVHTHAHGTVLLLYKQDG